MFLQTSSLHIRLFYHHRDCEKDKPGITRDLESLIQFLYYWAKKQQFFILIFKRKHTNKYTAILIKLEYNHGSSHPCCLPCPYLLWLTQWRQHSIFLTTCVYILSINNNLPFLQWQLSRRVASWVGFYELCFFFFFFFFPFFFFFAFFLSFFFIYAAPAMLGKAAIMPPKHAIMLWW